MLNLNLNTIFTNRRRGGTTVSLLELSIVQSYVTNENPDHLVVEFTRIVSIDDLTGISLSFDIGNPKTISSVSGSGTDTLIFILNTDVEYGDQFDIIFNGSSIKDSENNNIGNVESTVDSTDVQQVTITSLSDLDHWFNAENNSLVFKSDGSYAENGDVIIELFDAKDQFNLKLGNYNGGTPPRPTYDLGRKAVYLSPSNYLQTYLDEVDSGAGSGSTFFTECAGDFHDFWKIEIVGTNNVYLKNAKTLNRGIRLTQSTGIVRIWTGTGTARNFTATSKATNGNIIMLEIVRYGTTIECFVTDAVSRVSLGTVIDSGSWAGSSQTINNHFGVNFGTFYFYQHRQYHSDQRSNYEAIHSEMNF